MVTPRDLVEAHTYRRRRLVAALVSRPPGGPWVEAPGPGRALLGGLVLGGLLLAGALASEALTSRTPDHGNGPPPSRSSPRSAPSPPAPARFDPSRRDKYG